MSLSSHDTMTTTGGGGPAGFCHNALLYDSDEAYVLAVVPFLREGLAADEQVSVVTTAYNIALLREAMGSEADRVTFTRHADDGLTPARKVALLHEICSAPEAADHGGFRVVGEALFGSTTKEQLEWVRYEGILNAVFAASPQSFLCAYDRRRLPRWVVESAARTHPHLHQDGARAPSAAYTDPVAFARELNGDLVPPPPPDDAPADIDIEVDRGTLATVRSLLAHWTGEACTSNSQASQALVGINEVLTNALEHGGEQVRVRGWRHTDRLVCEVTDDGPGFDDPLAGYHPPRHGQLGGRGLWLARQTLDQVEVDRTPRGLRVYMSIAV